MAQIPSSAISAAVSTAQRTTTDSLHARRTQALKTQHHTEDVAELEEGAITAVNDEDSPRQSPDDNDNKENNQNPTPKKHLDIKSTGLKPPTPPPASALDIEA